ncbi:hypothetical protein V1Y59_20590 [Gordonia sp. PKS22-38]|uniref:Carboxymuconolactone decarboxylase n=1 Tax=Gordonia prachuapensis TaxID=3115651 RepID=A0ABU7N0F1_9ACTN|nr:hypothetical protein [Gordonia sp. PKS22-38]
MPDDTFDLPPLPPESAALLDKVVPPPHRPPLLYRAMAANPGVLRGYIEQPILGLRGLLHTGQLSADERELCVLRVTAKCDAEHEWGVHVAYFGKTSGLTQSQIDATVLDTDPEPGWSTRQRAVLDIVDAVVDMRRLDAAELAAIDRTLTIETRTEIVAVASLYLGISATCRVLGIPPEPGAPRFPSWTGAQRTP